MLSQEYAPLQNLWLLAKDILNMTLVLIWAIILVKYVFFMTDTFSLLADTILFH